MQYYGSCGVELYNEDRPHGAVGYTVPVALMNAGGDTGQPPS